MTSVVTVRSWYKTAHIKDQLGAKAIWAEYMADRIGPNVAVARFRELCAAARAQETLNV